MAKNKRQKQVDDMETVRDLLGLISDPSAHKQASEAFERLIDSYEDTQMELEGIRLFSKE